jgi:hypothetical protein
MADRKSSNTYRKPLGFHIFRKVIGNHWKPLETIGNPRSNQPQTSIRFRPTVWLTVTQFSIFLFLMLLVILNFLSPPPAASTLTRFDRP